MVSHTIVSRAKVSRVKTGLLVAAALALTGTLGACGIKGPLESPPESKAAEQATAGADSGQGKAEGAAPKPHKPFILDGLLR
jgi:predicted small lipoprotein YifL